MDAQQLATDLAQASAEEFPGDQPAEVFPSKYFNYGVRSIDPAEDFAQRNPNRCATPFGATQLGMVLLPLTGMLISMVMGNADIFAGLSGSFSDTEAVPWFIFTNSAGKASNPVNCAQLLNYFNHGDDAGNVQRAVQGVMAEIQAAFPSV